MSKDIALSPLPSSAFDGPLENRKRWTRTECEKLETLGVLPARYELLDGEIICRMPQFQAHTICISRITFHLMGMFGADRVQAQTSMTVAVGEAEINLPEPDVLVLAQPVYPLKKIPSDSDVLLIVEVSDTTLSNDLNFKAGLYARAGVGEYWVQDVNARHLIVHRNAQNGVYAEKTAYAEDDHISPLSSPKNSVRVGDLLPPLQTPE